jgi:hypothetical protein
VLLAGTLSADRNKTFTPQAIGSGVLVEVGTQGAGLDCAIINGGPLGGTMRTVVGGAREAVWFWSDGTDCFLTAFMPLGAEPAL